MLRSTNQWKICVTFSFMKLLFLDIDGVMTSNELIQQRNKSTMLYPFAREAVEALNDVLRTHALKIVLTSSWRTVFDVEKQCQIFKENGVIQVPFGATVDLGFENRSLEIERWLQNKKVAGFVILDDLPIDKFRENFLKIDPAEGLTRLHIPQINKILNNDSPS
jgi:hypothetical protein